MNCTQIEKLIPLYVEGDLEAERTAGVLSHLESCRHCRQLVAEFEESQSWLRGYRPPDFDEAFFDGMRAAVQREIAKANQPPFLFQWLKLDWNWRPILTASLALLLLSIGLMIYVHFEKEKNRSQVAHSGSKPTPDLKGSPSTPTETNNNILAGGEQPTLPKLPERSIRLARRKPSLTGQPKPEPLPEQANIFQPAITAGPETRQTTTANVTAEPEMLRIEIQTADPHIRIIWFAPKETNSQSTKIDRETE